MLACNLGWDGLTAIATAVIAVTGFVALIYAACQLSEFKRESRVKHLLDLVTEFERNPMADYRRALANSRLTSDGKLRTMIAEEPPFGLHDVLNFFEHVGLLVDRKYLDVTEVWISFKFVLFNLWADGEAVVRHEQGINPTYYEHLKKLEQHFERLEKKRTGRFELPLHQDIEDFYYEEARRAIGSPVPRRHRKKRDT